MNFHSFIVTVTLLMHKVKQFAIFKTLSLLGFLFTKQAES